MKPRFALNLTSEAAVLLRRQPDGWTDMGAARFDAPDMDEVMAALAAQATEMAGDETLATKVVIPNSQILYTTLTAPGPDRTSRRAQIREGLDGLTPYEVKDLVYDFETDGDQVRLAVVARETLDEAEGFADQHGLNPVCFVAIPEGQFPREPWFGTVTNVQRRLPKGERVERDSEPIRLAASGVADVMDEAPATADDEWLPAVESTQEPVPASEPEPVADQPEAVTPRAAETPFDTAAPLAEAAPAGEEMPAPSDPLAGLAPSEAAAPLPAPEPEPETLADVPPPDEGPAAPPSPAEDFVPPPLVRTDRIPAEDDPQDRPIVDARDLPPFVPSQPDTTAKQAPFAAPKPDVTAPEIPEAPYVELDADDDVPDLPPGAFASRRLVAEPATARPSPRLTAEPKAPRAGTQPPEPPLRPGTGRSARPRTLPAGPAPAGAALPELSVTAPGIPGVRNRKPQPAAAPLAPPEPATARAGQPFGTFPTRPAQRGKPRHLGLILTAVLLLVLAAVAAWSSFYLTADDAPTETAVALAEGDDPAAIEAEMLADLPPEDEADLAPMAEPAATVTQPETATPPAETAPDAARTAASGATPRAADPTETPQDEIFLTTMDTPPPSLDALALPPPAAAPDAAPGPPLPPPPFGISYEFDEAGLIRPTPEGILAPGDFLLIAGKPPILPPRRPGTETPAPDPASQEPPAEPTAAAAAEPAAQPSPGSIFPGATAPAARATLPPPAQTAPEPAPVAADPALIGKRPKPRPERPAEDAAIAPPPADPGDPRTASLRPRARPADAVPAPAAASVQSASLVAPAPRPETEPQAIVPTSGAISPLAIAVSRKPAARPNDFSRAIEAAVAAVVQTPTPPAAIRVQPEPEAEPEDEPEVARAAAPRIPTKANVAQKATFDNAINLSKMNLIGVYGTPSNRYALVRQANGRYVKVRVGDRLDGGVVAAITTNELRYRKGSRMVALGMPRG